MTDQNTLILMVTVISFIQIVMLAWIKYRQSECDCGTCKGSCLKVKGEEIETNETNFSSLNSNAYQSIKV